MFTVVEILIPVDGEDDMQVITHGPYNSHQQANSIMQQLHDAAVEDAGDDAQYSDDTDAGHFVLERSDAKVHWMIAELSKTHYQS